VPAGRGPRAGAWRACQMAAAALPAPPSAATLRQRSLELLVRSLGGEEAERRLSQTPEPKRPRGPAAAEGVGGARDLLTLRAELAAAREAGTGTGPGPGVVLHTLARLAERPVTPSELRVSELGRELNQRFWREHQEVASRCRALLARWRAAVAGARTGGAAEAASASAAAAGGAAAAAPAEAAASPGKGNSAEAAEVKAVGPLAWDAAWAEAGAARCAQDIEVAAWLKCSEGPAKVEATADTEHMRLYKGKVRFLAAALRRPENAALLRLALEGRVTGEFIAGREEEEFLPEARRAERQQHRKEGLRSVCLQEQALDRFDADHKCPRCGKAGARYTVVGDTGSVIVDSISGVKRQKSRKRMLYQCASCEERWQEDDGWHV